MNVMNQLQVFHWVKIQLLPIKGNLIKGQGREELGGGGWGAPGPDVRLVEEVL